MPTPMLLESRLWTSPDGIHWRLKKGVKWQKEPPDLGPSAFWNDVRQSYVLTTRPNNGDRRIAVFETRDWENFTKPELALQADALDSPLAEMYGMPVIAYQGYYIGFLWLYHVAPQIKGDYHKFYDGHVDCQLAYSLNGWHFQRTLRDPFIVYLESCGGPGIIATRMLYWKGGELELNVQSQNGTARVQVTDVKSVPLPGYTFAECHSFSGDDTAWRPVWQEQRTLGALNNARLYALRGDFVPMIGPWSVLSLEQGKVPQEPSPGF